MLSELAIKNYPERVVPCILGKKSKTPGSGVFYSTVQIKHKKSRTLPGSGFSVRRKVKQYAEVLLRNHPNQIKYSEIHMHFT